MSQPSRICLYDKGGVLLHEAATPEAVAEVERLLDAGPVSVVEETNPQ